MLRIVHNKFGNPADVLTVVKGDRPELGPDLVRIRVSLAPIHPGDLLAIRGSPAFGEPPPIGPDGRVPGFEGAGTITEIGRDVEPAFGLHLGMRVAFFPAAAAWAEEVVLAPGSLVPLPDDVADDVGAQMLINSVTALTVANAALDVSTPILSGNAVVVQTAAGSSVGRLVSRLLMDRGVNLIRLVRSDESARTLSATLPGAPVVAIDAADWKASVQVALAGRSVPVAIDSVGGSSLGDLAALVDEGATIVNFGSLGGGEASDIRLFAPRSLTLKGVTMTSWFRRTPMERSADIALTLELARTPQGLFDTDRIASAHDVADAVTAINRRGRVGAMLLRF